MSTARSYIAEGRHPLPAIPPHLRNWLAATLAAAAFVIHRRQRVNAKSPAAPHGTMSFALADGPEEARRIRSSWPRSTQQAVDNNLRLDTLFSITWTNAITLADLWSADRMTERGWAAARMGDALAWTQWGAALLAVTKDVEKLGTLRERTNGLLERVGRWTSITEIVTKTAGIAYAAVPVIATAVEWGRRRR